MLVVVADTSPIRYLVEIGQAALLPQLFDKIFIPALVYDELCHASAPPSVRTWVNSLPGWLEVLPVRASNDPEFQSLDEGERSALTLGMTLRAELILIDDRKGAAAARRKGFEIAGTLGVLTRAAQRGLIDLASALARLKRTNFHYRQELLDELLRKYGDGGQGR